jgi:hypothetical protein
MIASLWVYFISLYEQQPGNDLANIINGLLYCISHYVILLYKRKENNLPDIIEDATKCP